MDLKRLVEQVFEENYDTKVTLVAISMGGLVSLYFLTQIVNQEWKDKFIHSYITLAAAWSGASTFLVDVLTQPPANVLLSRYEIQASVEELRDLIRSFASSYFLSPHKSVWKDTILVTPTDNYTASDYQSFSVMLDIHKDTLSSVKWT